MVFAATAAKIYSFRDSQVVSEPRGSRSRVDKNSDKSCVAKAYGRKEMLFCDRFCDDFVTLLRLYLLYGSAGVREVTATGGRSYKESSRSEAGLKPSDVVMSFLQESEDSRELKITEKGCHGRPGNKELAPDKRGF
ncbi:hypothetical protein Tco_0964181 [Tanacetum coccineum]